MNKIYYIATTREFGQDICGYYSDFATAKKNMIHFSNWWRPKGTGRIYEVDLNIPTTDVLGKQNPRLVYENL